MRTYQKEKRTIRKQLKKTRGGAFRVTGKQTISNKKNCYKCAGDCECIGVWEIDSTTVEIQVSFIFIINTTLM